MHRLNLLFLAVLSFTLIGAIPKDQIKQAPPLAEDRDWASYVFDGATTADMNQRCLEGYKTLDKRMAEVLSSFKEQLDEQGIALLDKNQKAWRAYALSKRAMAADTYRGGTLAGPVAGVSYIQEKCRRIEELKAAMKAREPQ